MLATTQHSIYSVTKESINISEATNNFYAVMCIKVKHLAFFYYAMTSYRFQEDNLGRKNY